jgi:Ran GTPase-activating protein (RanGAP) involved in mRNA processing and transport
VWLYCIGPRLSIRYIVALSMVSSWTKEVAHGVRLENGCHFVADKSKNLEKVRLAVKCWPNVRLGLCVDRDSSHAVTYEQLMKNMDVAQRVAVLEMFDTVMFDPRVIGSSTEKVLVYQVRLDKESCEQMGHVLAQSRNLKSVVLYSTNLGDKVEFIAEGIRQHTSLAQLTLRNTCITSHGAHLLAGAVSHNSALKTLNLGYNPLGAGALSVVSLLALPSSLASLDLQSCGLQIETVRCLASHLRTNKRLHHLSVNHNSLGVEGGRAIAEALVTNTALEDLELSDNMLEEEGTNAVINALRDNHTLKSLSLINNNAKEESARLLMNVLDDNTTVMSVLLYANEVKAESINKIDSRLRERRKCSV